MMTNPSSLTSVRVLRPQPRMPLEFVALSAVGGASPLAATSSRAAEYPLSRGIAAAPGAGQRASQSKFWIGPARRHRLNAILPWDRAAPGELRCHYALNGVLSLPPSRWADGKGVCFDTAGISSSRPPAWRI